jgi:hypothetical protein
MSEERSVTESSLGRIDRAFLLVERAMPTGFAMTKLGWHYGVWVAEAKPIARRGFRSYRERTGQRAGKGTVIQADGTTPQEALIGLAARLDEFRALSKTDRKHDAVDSVIAAVFGA